MSNTNDFYEYTGRLFGFLCGSFPEPKNINARYIADLVNNKENEEAVNDKCEITTYTVKWLDKYGYIHVDQYAQYMFYDMHLTEKSLWILTSTSDNKSLGEKIMESMKNNYKMKIMSFGREIMFIGLQSHQCYPR